MVVRTRYDAGGGYSVPPPPPAGVTEKTCARGHVSPPPLCPPTIPTPPCRSDGENLCQGSRFPPPLIPPNHPYSPCRSDGGNLCQWFFFAMWGIVPGVAYKFNIVNFKKKSSLFGAGKRPLVCRGQSPSAPRNNLHSAPPSAEARATAHSGGRPSSCGSGSGGDGGGGGPNGAFSPRLSSFSSPQLREQPQRGWIRAGHSIAYYPSPYRGRTGKKVGRRCPMTLPSWQQLLLQMEGWGACQGGCLPSGRVYMVSYFGPAPPPPVLSIAAPPSPGMAVLSIASPPSPLRPPPPSTGTGRSHCRCGRETGCQQIPATAAYGGKRRRRWWCQQQRGACLPCVARDGGNLIGGRARPTLLYVHTPGVNM